MLSGRRPPLDAAKTHVRYTNDSSQDVVVTVEGPNVRIPRQVASRSACPEVLDECQGTGISVETDGGKLIGRVKAQACPDWTLRINENGTLDYAQQ